jgi:hypothetical protein
LSKIIKITEESEKKVTKGKNERHSVGKADL